MDNVLTVSIHTFNLMLSGLIQSGVSFKATEVKGLLIQIEFTGGY